MKSIWQRLWSAHWIFQLLAGTLIGSLSTALFSLAGINETIAWIAGFLGINFVVFSVVGFLAHEDDLRQ